MTRGSWNRTLKRLAVANACLAVVLLACVAEGGAQQLSFRHYGVADGLARSYVKAIYQDSKGYIWFGTPEGLSRFDGYRFTNYGTRDGLGNQTINAITEDQIGRLWVGTAGGGVARLIEDSPKVGQPSSDKFVNHPVGESPGSNQVNSLLFDHESNFWCATDTGLYRASLNEAGEPRAFDLVAEGKSPQWNSPAFADSRGRSWFGVGPQLIEIAQGQIIKYGASDGVGSKDIQAVLEDRDGRLLLANLLGIFEFVEPSNAMSRGQWRRLPLDLISTQAIHSMAADASGTLWLGTSFGLAEYKDGRQTLYTTANGLSDHHILSLGWDRENNLWIGTVNGGACRFSGKMIMSLDSSSGLADLHIYDVIESRQGRIYAASDAGWFEIEITKGRAVRPSWFKTFGGISRLLQDKSGNWWIGTNTDAPSRHTELRSLLIPELNLAHMHKSKLAIGIASGEIESIYEDAAGRVWASVLYDDHLYWIDRGDMRPVFHKTSIHPFGYAHPIVVDRSEAWFGSEYALASQSPTGSKYILARSLDGRVSILQPAEGLSDSQVRSLFLDSRGSMWVGFSSGGVSVTTDPTADQPKFVNYSTANGLASDAVASITEDDFGRIYLGTGRGLDQLDVSTGRIRHFTSADGLSGDKINACIKDSHGFIWVGASGGVSRLDPRAERKRSEPPPVYLTHLQIAGENLPVSETGALSIPPLELTSSRNNLVIEYVGLSFSGHQQLKYQYKLEGLGADWSAPVEGHSVNYAHLAPGRYRFLVKAIDKDGLSSIEPAVLEFRILSPVWQRWWFVTLAALVAALAAYSLYRYRVARLIELERVRTRIATDLHDDIGSNLSLIAMVSEVAKHRVDSGDTQMADYLTLISGTSHELVDSMSDIVWAVNPKRDRLSDLTHRMRRFADDIFSARGIAFTFREPAADPDLKLSASLRQEIFLIFKEGVNNVVRHSQCTESDIDFQIDGGWMTLKLSDNGKGFDPALVTDGNGLMSMQKRAISLGGEFQVVSGNGGGTTLRLRARLDQRS
jgi:signal transduction histidine kinase/ligand-binding sensor domain-containing protein